jgi:hypothetical protein
VRAVLRPLLIACVVAFLAPAEVGGEDAISLGTRVRVLAPRIAERAIVGVLVGADGDDLVVKQAGSNVSIAVPRIAISRLEMSQGRASKAKGALVGAGMGAAAGAAFGAGPRNCRNAPGCEALTDTAFGSNSNYVAGSVLVGAGVGALVGALVTRGERWRVAPTDSVSISLATPGGRSIGLRVGIAF